MFWFREIDLLFFPKNPRRKKEVMEREIIHKRENMRIKHGHSTLKVFFARGKTKQTTKTWYIRFLFRRENYSVEIFFLLGKYCKNTWMNLIYFCIFRDSIRLREFRAFCFSWIRSLCLEDQGKRKIVLQILPPSIHTQAILMWMLNWSTRAMSEKDK